MLIVIICERAVTPLPLACVGARRIAIAWFDAIVVWHKYLFEMCSPRRAHLPHGLRGDKGEQLRKHGVTGV